MPLPPFPDRIFLLLGANLGDPNQHIESAREAITKSAGTIVRKSAVYRSAPWGKTDQPWFLNQAIEISSSLEPFELLQTLQRIEASIGREQSVKWGPRKIDIDILYYGNRTVNEPHLKVPHPLVAERRFVLVPLCEIAPDFTDPIRSKRIDLLLKECSDNLSVELL